MFCKKCKDDLHSTLFCKKCKDTHSNFIYFYLFWQNCPLVPGSQTDSNLKCVLQPGSNFNQPVIVFQATGAYTFAPISAQVNICAVYYGDIEIQIVYKPCIMYINISVYIWCLLCGIKLLINILDMFVIFNTYRCHTCPVQPVHK